MYKKVYAVSILILGCIAIFFVSKPIFEKQNHAWLSAIGLAFIFILSYIYRKINGRYKEIAQVVFMSLIILFIYLLGYF